MKRLFFLFAVIFITIHVSAQRVTVDNVPDTVAAAFKAKFSTAEKVSWGVDDDNYLADFKISKTDYTATFDRNGNWIATEKFIRLSELPNIVRDIVNEEFGQFSAYTCENLERVETENGVVYEMEITKGGNTYNVVVSENGEMLKKEVKKES